MSVYVFTIQGEKGDMGVAGPIGPQGIPVSAVTEHNLTFPTMYKCIHLKNRPSVMSLPHSFRV